MPDIFIIGGPNGAGKTTAACGMLPSFIGVSQFVNADEIARGLSGFAPESVSFEAGRIMLRRLRSLAGQRVDFAFETTLASRSFVPWIGDLRDMGFRLHVIYLWLPNPELALQRVALRVKAGGHHVPEEVVRRRYERGRENFMRSYLPLADSWEAYDNSGLEPMLVAKGGRDAKLSVLDAVNWQAITKGRA
jgi:predicted ABC-type ATPase